MNTPPFARDALTESCNDRAIRPVAAKALPVRRPVHSLASPRFDLLKT
jgi:hypothetical protein